jgi:hypothetical protein
MSLEIKVLALVVLADAALVGISIAMDWTPLTNQAQREDLYRQVSNLRMGLFGVLMASFSLYNLYEWYAASAMYGGRDPWVQINEHPIYFSFLGVGYSLSALMFICFPVLGLAKLLGIWRMSTAPKN